MAGPRPLWGWGHAERWALALLSMAFALPLWAFGKPGHVPSAVPPASMMIEINTAPAMALLALPGLGPTRVDRILSAREEGPFDSLNDLAHRVKGIGPATLEGIRPFVRVDPPPPAGSPPITDR